MYIKYHDVCTIDFQINDISAFNLTDKNTYNYTQSGRAKHLLFYLTEHERSYFTNNKHIKLIPGDILFIPHGTKYKSIVENQNGYAKGICLTFNLSTQSGESVFFDEEMCVFKEETYTKCRTHFEKILFSTRNANKNVLKLKAHMYSLLEELFSENVSFSEQYRDIFKAIKLIEKHPENNASVKELADICHMSESTFMRKFKEYSGGVTPVKYRNKMRLMIAEELCTSLSLEEVAEKLGFYDSSHLCKIYKQTRNHTLKSREK